MNICLNPECFQGDPGNPPEYLSTNPVECSVCGEKYDADDDPLYHVKRRDVCEDCVEHCQLCGEPLDDEHIEEIRE